MQTFEVPKKCIMGDVKMANEIYNSANESLP